MDQWINADLILGILLISGAECGTYCHLLHTSVIHSGLLGHWSEGNVRSLWYVVWP